MMFPVPTPALQLELWLNIYQVTKAYRFRKVQMQMHCLTHRVHSFKQNIAELNKFTQKMIKLAQKYKDITHFDSLSEKKLVLG